MSSYRQIRPSWMDVRQNETVIEVTPARTAPTAAPAPAQTAPAAAPAPAQTAPAAPTGTAAIYQQVIASLQNQVNTLLNMYMENREY